MHLLKCLSVHNLPTPVNFWPLLFPRSWLVLLEVRGQGRRLNGSTKECNHLTWNGRDITNYFLWSVARWKFKRPSATGGGTYHEHPSIHLSLNSRYSPWIIPYISTLSAFLPLYSTGTKRTNRAWFVPVRLDFAMPFLSALPVNTLKRRRNA